MFHAPIELVRIDLERGFQRFYRLYLRPDLFDPVCLVREWGQIGNRGGQRRVQPFNNQASAQAALDRILQEKLRKGYRKKS